jgi:type VII secretion-associated serine protease mycosin
MYFRFKAVAGVITLIVAIVAPSAPAHADSFRDDQWYLKTLKVSQAQAISTGSGITVAVIDSGVSPHPDIRPNLLPGINLIPGASGNGEADTAGHGTNMAAIIAAHGRGKEDGVIGIAPSSKILPIKVGNKEDQSSVGALIKSFTWARDHGAKVINASLGTGPSLELIDAVGSAIDGGVVVVSAAGNTSKQAIINYPAAIDGVLTVGSVDHNGRHASFSVTDPKVQICAPGVDITTAQPPNKYVDVDGTSASTAIVSGAVALVRAKFPRLSGAEVVHRITATADDIGPPGRDDQCGFGELNIVKALTADVPPLGGGSPSPSSAASSAAGGSAPTGAGSSSGAVAEGASGSGSLLVGGLAVVVVLGALVAVLVVRRRRVS